MFSHHDETLEMVFHILHEVPTSFITFPFLPLSVYVHQISKQNQTVGGEENLLDIQISVCYIMKHLEDRKV